MDWLEFVFGKQLPQDSSQSEESPLQTFILEPILTPSGIIDGPDNTHPVVLDVTHPLPEVHLPQTDSSHSVELPIDTSIHTTAATGDLAEIPFFNSHDLTDSHAGSNADATVHALTATDATHPDPTFTSGTFTVGEKGFVSFDNLFHGGKYKGQVAIFSLDGIDKFTPGSPEFIHEVALRAASNTPDGHIVISSATEAARFSGIMGSEAQDWNSGEYLGVKTFNMRPGDSFGMMLVPNGTVQQVLDGHTDGALRPLFSMVSANPNEAFHVGQVADVNGHGNTFVMEDMRIDGGSDRDFNDVIFQIHGATGKAVHVDDLINPTHDWRTSELGGKMMEFIKPPENQPLIGIIDTGVSANNPNLDQFHIHFGAHSDYVAGDGNPLLHEGESSEHGTFVTGIIAATQPVETHPISDTSIHPIETSEIQTQVADSNIASQHHTVVGINDQAPIYEARAVGSGQWSQALTDFVDAAKESGQKNAIANLSLDLTQVNHDGSVTTRYEFTPVERAALEYARQNHVLIVTAAGNDGGVMSVLGQSSQEFDNIITVGAAKHIDVPVPSVTVSTTPILEIPIANSTVEDAPLLLNPSIPSTPTDPTDAVTTPASAFDRAEYSNYGYGLNIMADGGTLEHPVVSTVGDGLGTMAGTSVSAAYVTGAASQVWAANPELSYRQVIDILEGTATDLKTPGWDLETGPGLLDMAAAVHLAKTTDPEPQNVKPESGTITNNTTYAAPGKQLPSEPAHPAVTPPEIPQTTVDTGGNDLANATKLVATSTQDIIDQVSSIDPTDNYRVASRYFLAGVDMSVLSGELSVSFLTPSGQLLSQQVLGKGTHKLQLSGNLPSEVIVKIDQRNGNPATYTLKNFESAATEPFNINLEFEGGLTTSQQAIMQAAAKSVASLIKQGLPTAIVDGKIIDDINIKVSTANLDGISGTQAQTKIDFMRYKTLLPAQSITQFDAADIAQLEGSGELFSVAQHEFLHALGFGNLWEAKGLVDYAGTPLAQYNGQQAVDAFKDLGGLTDAISLETEGKGSAGLHWNEALFQDEVMTYDLGFKQGADGQVFSPISAVTIASLADLGYQVNLNRATPDFGLFGGQKFNPENLTPEQIEAFRQLAEESVANQSGEFIPAIMPEVDPNKVAPEIWAHAERGPDGEYYDWEDYQIVWGDTLSELAEGRMGSGSASNFSWIASRNGIADPDYIQAGKVIKLPVHRPNYEQEQEAERQRREQELRQRQEQEARDRQQQEDRLRKDQGEQERLRQDEERRRQEAEANRRALEEQARRLAEEQERRRREREEYEREQARLAELRRQAEIARQQGKGGLEWYLAKPLPEFGPVDPFETSLTGETVGNLVPDDYYRFTLSRGGRITAELRKLLADADLVLYDVRNEPIAYSMREGITDEQIIADLIPGTYMLRVNSPKGVTTDYELIVKFQHKLSQMEIGPPPGWKVGGNSNGGGSGGGNTSGPTFSDPRLKQVYDTALNNFEVPLKRTLDSQVAELKAERAQYEQEQRKILDQMSAELRGKVYAKLDDISNNLRGRIDSVANDLSGRNDALNNINNVIPDWASNAPFVGNAVRNVRDNLRGAVNGAWDWLEGQVNGVRNTIKDLIWQFTQKLKDAYKTAAEINTDVEMAAQWLRNEIDKQVGNLNGLIGSFKGKILAPMEFAKNVQVGSWNAYNALSGLVNGAINGVQNAVSAVGGFFKDKVSDAEYLVQQAVGEIAHLLGDDTGRKYNEMRDKMQEIDNQINDLTGKTENTLRSKKVQIEAIVRKLEVLLTDPEERNRVLDLLLKYGYKNADEAYDFVVNNLDKISQQIAEEKARQEAEEKAKKEAEEKAKKEVSQMSYVDKLMAAAKLAIEQLPGDVQKTLTEPTFWALMVFMLTALAGLHTVGIGELIDVALIWVFGLKAAWDLGAFFGKAAAAQDQQGLQDTANSFKEFIGDVGPIAVGKAFELIRGVLPATNETIKFQKLLSLFGNDKSRLGKLLSLVGNDVTKLESLLGLVGNDVTKLENLLSLIGNDVTKLENLSRLVGNDKVALLLDLQEVKINGNPVKFTAENIVRIDRAPDGKIIFLEQGNSRAGLQHIREAHATDFANKKITEEQIPDAVMAAVTKGKVVNYQGQDIGRPIYQLDFNGTTQYIAVTVSDNGFIVGANPTSFP